MSCLFPLQAWRGRLPGASGLRPISLSTRNANSEDVVFIPCGVCIECKKARARDWAIRCYHESKLHDENCFITLTFDNEHLCGCCPDGSLNPTLFVNFMKRLRKYFVDKNIKFFHCGEYGSELSRPHHHACLFGVDFPDKELHEGLNSKRPLYTSKILLKLWPYGYNIIGECTLDSAYYIASYVVKKVRSEKFYKGRHSEYVTMSRGGRTGKGLGYAFYEKYGTDVLKLDSCEIEGKLYPVPRYYDKLLQGENPALLETIKEKRKEKIRELSQVERVEQVYKNQRLQELNKNEILKKRGYENETITFRNS